MLEIGSQVRTSQQVQLARENLARLRARAEVLLVEPVPYQRVRGTGFYEQFIDSTEWPDFIRAGHETTLAALRAHPRAGRHGPTRVASTGTGRQRPPS